MSVTLINPYRYATAGFTDPSSITGLQLWLDADDAATFTFSSGVVVSQWNDKSGNARHVAQGTVGSQPSRNGTQNARTTVVFDGIDDYMTYDAGSDAVDISPWSFFAVVKDTGGNSQERILSCRASSTVKYDYESPNAIFGYRSTTNLGAYANGTASALKAYSASTWLLFRSTSDGTNVQVAVDGSATSNTAATAAGNVRYLRLAADCSASANPPAMNAINDWTGQIAEIVLYNATLSAGEITSVESYLRTRWGTP